VSQHNIHGYTHPQDGLSLISTHGYIHGYPYPRQACGKPQLLALSLFSYDAAAYCLNIGTWYQYVMYEKELVDQLKFVLSEILLQVLTYFSVIFLHVC